MKYFIETVQTYTVSGKTKKGRILQGVASSFEHAILADHDALISLVRDLACLVDTVNKAFKGSRLILIHSESNGYICVKPENNYNDNHVFCIYYAPVASNLETIDIMPKLEASLWDLGAADIYSAIIEKGGEA